MRIKENCFVSFYLLLAVVALQCVRSFQPRRHRKVGPTERSRYHRFSAEEDDRGRMLMELTLTSPSPSSSSSSSTSSSTSRETSLHYHPWYSHPDIERDRSHVQKRYNSLSDILNRYREEQQGEQKCDDGDGDGDGDPIVDFTNDSKFLMISSKGMWHQKSSSSPSFTASPLYLTVNQLDNVITGTKITESSSTNSDDDESSTKGKEPLVAWVGKYQNENYWVVHLGDDDIIYDSGTEPQSQLKSVLVETCSTRSEENTLSLCCDPLREFGDSLEASHDAGILATANGLVEFHKSHGYCSRCGGPTRASKAGASRTCTNERCSRSVYPRIDSATIMLVTSPCDQFALLGRKRSWPSGRYSTLAGFCEVGETLEECCQRETFEESGVVVDPKSVRFVASQPWPFPRSLMVGFRAKAIMTLSSASASAVTSPLPNIIVDTNEMEDIRWFAKEFVKERLSLSGSTALTFQPSEDEAEFHIPGKASLARYLITEWTDEEKIELISSS